MAKRFRDPLLIKHLKFSIEIKGDKTQYSEPTLFPEAIHGYIKEQMSSELFGNSHSGAEFSVDRSCRFVLWRVWDASKPKVAFIGLNPSTANETEPDPTITRVINFAKAWGYGGVYMLNLFACVTSKPKEINRTLFTATNDAFIEQFASRSERVVFAWGAFQVDGKNERAAELIKMFPDAYCLKITKDGHPWHPLYVRGNIKPIQFFTSLNLSQNG
jgi:hypothetical protein